MQHETLRRHLNDLARLGARQRRLKHRLMDLGVKPITDLRVNHMNAVLAKDVEQLTHGQLDALNQGRGHGALFLGHRLHGALEIVKHRQHVAR